MTTIDSLTGIKETVRAGQLRNIAQEFREGQWWWLPSWEARQRNLRRVAAEEEQDE